jgi:hypothetical protein
VARPARTRDPFRDGQPDTVTLVERPAIDLHYDYEQLPEAHREQIKRSALTIKPRLKRAAEDIFVIGRELSAIKENFPHGEYGRWLDIEFGLSDRMAQRFVNVYARLGIKSDKLSDLPPSTLYMLSAKSTPDEAIQEIEKQIEAQGRLSVAYVEQAIADAKSRAKPAGETVIEGEVVLDDELVDKARHLEEVLSQAADLLKGPPLNQWKTIFHDNELRRIQKEIVELRTKLRRRLRGTTYNQK